MSLMKSIRESLAAGQFPQFVNRFMSAMYPNGKFPDWVVDALSSVNIQLNSVNVVDTPTETTTS